MAVLGILELIKGCPIPKCGVMKYEVADSWRKPQGRWQYRFGYALKIHVPKEFWTKGNEQMGFTVLLRRVFVSTLLIG